MTLHTNAPVRKAVFPVAGLGTRFLPATKASPKEMLPVVDKPLIQYAVEEAYAAGVRHMIFVTGRSKRAIEDHFDTDHELEEALEAQKKHELLKALKDILEWYAMAEAPVWAASALARSVTSRVVTVSWSGVPSGPGRAQVALTVAM